MYKTFAISGVTLSGNMGGQAMLLATMNQIKMKSPNSKVILFSVYPNEDKGMKLSEGTTIVNASPLLLLLIFFPIMIFLWPIRKSRVIARILRQIPYFKYLFQCDILLDHSGISFSDGRGLPLLIYNVCCVLPGLFVGIPVIKLSQALGPFNSKINHVVAKWTLSKCAQVNARGHASYQHLKNLGLNNIAMHVDVSFVLDVKDNHYEVARQKLKSIGIDSPPVIISPSHVVNKYCRKYGINYEKELIEFISHLALFKDNILLLPHSLGHGKNDDITLSRKIFDRAGVGKLFMIDDVRDARVLRAIISHGKLFVGSRFHSIISALSEKKPFIAIGWGHKYEELVRPFGLVEYVLDYTQLHHSKLSSLFHNLMDNYDRVRDIINGKIGSIMDDASSNYKFLHQDGNSC